MFKKVAIANRGAVAARLVKALAKLKVKSLVLCSEADKDLPYVKMADDYRVIGPPPSRESYLNHEAVLAAAIDGGAEALHPGYGFLSEDAVFARRLLEKGLSFIGPDPRWLEIMGDKTAARREMASHGLPMGASTGELTGNIEQKVSQAAALGFPLLIKPAGGGGGIGMIPVHEMEKLPAALETASSQALRSFGQVAVYAERLLENPRHVEFQIVADGHKARHLFERDCSVQRRRQKVIEEAGAPVLDRNLLNAMAEKSAAVLEKLGYNHLATVETLYDRTGTFSFLEVNPRLQVEHGVTEEITGVDLVATQVRLAAGEPLDVLEGFVVWPELSGHALEVRIYAEDSLRFLPSPGLLKVFRPPHGEGIRVETGLVEGAMVTPFYDPMIAQVIVKSDSRAKSIELMDRALADFVVEGIKTNIGFVRSMLAYEPFRTGQVHTGLADLLIREPYYKENLTRL